MERFDFTCASSHQLGDLETLMRHNQHRVDLSNPWLRLPPKEELPTGLKALLIGE